MERLCIASADLSDTHYGYEHLVSFVQQYDGDMFV